MCASARGPLRGIRRSIAVAAGRKAPATRKSASRTAETWREAFRWRCALMQAEAETLA